MAKESQQSAAKRVKAIITALKKAYPDAKLELDFSSPLELLIALILAAQARDDLINSVTSELFKKFPTAAAWVKADEKTLHGLLGKINFYRNKTRSIQKACRVLIDEFGGQVPETLDELLKLPGVGRKTANVILGNAFGQPAIGVDTHVKRLSERLGLTRQTDPDEIESDLVKIVPRNDSVRFCHLLQFHGRRVCKAKSPDCAGCPINSLCPWPK